MQCMRLLGTVSPSLRNLKELTLTELSGTLGHVEHVAELLGTDSLPNLLLLRLQSVPGAPMGNAGASALASAFGRGAMSSLETLGEWLLSLHDADRTRIEPRDR